MQPKELTPRALVTIVIGLVVLTTLSVWQLFFRDRPVDSPAQRVVRGETMGTFYTVKVIGAELAETELHSGVQSVLDAVNGKMSTYIDDSELSRFNAWESTEPFPLSDETLVVMAEALEVSRATGGAYDITIGPLVNAWGFGPDGPTNEPTDEEIESLLARTGYEHLSVDTEAGAATKAVPTLYCDLSSIAKGHAVDRVAEWLEDQGIGNYMVELGGEVRTGSRNKDNVPWQMGIRKPIPNDTGVHRVIGLSGQAMATSGDYQNFFMRDGQRVAHIIDPRTGRPIRSSAASVTVIHESCALADAYATALIVLGPKEGLAFAEEHGLAALFILREDDETFRDRPTTRFTEQFGAETDDTGV